MIGLDFRVKNLALPTGPLKLQVWEIFINRFTLMPKYFYNNACGVVIVYSVTDRSSFDGVDKWMKVLNKIEVNAPIIIIGSKCECEEERVVEKIHSR